MKLYNLLIPEKTRVPILATIPHSGIYVPSDIRKQFRQNPKPVLTNMDWHLDKLYDFLPELGITVLQAAHSRYVVDLNREAKEPLVGPNSSSVISQYNTQGSPLYAQAPSKSEIETRLTKYYYPFHEKLKAILEEMTGKFGYVFLIDLHSYFLYPVTDACLGNCNGITCSDDFINTVEQALNRQDFSVVKNEGFTGGYITRHYGSIPNIASLQIELRFPVYLNGDYFGEEEITEWDCDRFRNAKTRLRAVFGDIIKGLD
jgi:N-formylglutamate deformylase